MILNRSYNRQLKKHGECALCWRDKLSEGKAVLEIEGPHFTLRLYEDWLRIDLRGNTKDEIAEALENKPVLKQSIGSILEIFAPLHIHLSDIDSVHMDSLGKVKLVLPRRRDVTIPLTVKEAKTFVDTLNPLIEKEKEKKIQRVIEERKRARSHAMLYGAILGLSIALAGLFGYLIGSAH
jgi:hypothetical protein